MNRNKQKLVEAHLQSIFKLLGFNPLDPSVADTPKRIAKMWCNEICNDLKYENIEELKDKMTFFEVPHTTVEPITMEMPFSSWCEHHFLPFFGTIRITYIPKDKLIGLSKIPRIVEYFSQRPQLQERLGEDIAYFLMNVVEARGVKVEIFNTTHTCVSCRGIRYNADTRTEYKIGEID